VLKIVGYTDRLSVRPGESLAFKVSCEGGAPEYDAEIVRLICGDDSPRGPGFKAEPIAASINGRYPGRQQRVNAGSFGVIPRGVQFAEGAGFTVAALVYPTWLAKQADQAVVACRTVAPLPGQGWSLLVDAEGRGRFEVSNGQSSASVTLDRALPERRWSLLVATLQDGALTLVHRLLHPLPHETEIVAATAPLGFHPAHLVNIPVTIGAELAAVEGERLFTKRHFDGKIEAPLIRPPVADSESRAVIDDLADECHAGWEFSLAIDSQRIVDASGNGHDGRLVNLPTRAVTGHNWKGQTLRWSDRPDLYGAIHFHCDDLHDMQWETDFTWTIPPDLPSGVYAARVSCAANGEDFLPFFVLPAKTAQKAPVAFLASTFTFLAYANSHHGYEDALSEVC